MSAKKPSKRRSPPAPVAAAPSTFTLPAVEGATVRLALLFVLSALAVAGLLYSVYGGREGTSLVAGEPSPELYKSPVDVEVVDQLATEREREAARGQIEPVYTANATTQALVVNALTTAGLPTTVQDFVVARYNQPEGVREEALPALASEATRLAPEGRRREVALLLERTLLPTSRENPVLTAAAREAAAEAVPPVMQRLKAGQTVVREGELLTPDHLRVLEAVGLYNPRAEETTKLLWLLLGCALMGGLLSLPLAFSYHRLGFRLTDKQIVFLVVLTLLTLAAQRLAILASPTFFFVFLVPLLVAVLVSDLAAVLWGVWLAVVVALFEPGAPLLTLITVLVGTTASSLVPILFRTRTTLLLAGVLSGLGAALSYGAFHFLLGTFGTFSMLFALLWILAGGVIAGILALGLLPLAESSIGFLTEFRLLELSSPSSPLLQKLLIEAPGSYQHSLIISNLVEQAVTNIGGNALLARVGALYHDVGKLKRPGFFVENQFSGENPHDQLSPHLSYLVITSHVRDGAELLREYRLPKALEPFVTEHHGTTVLSYFYKRALEDSDKLDEFNFRYPGPRPRSKETAVLMLADAVESASRTLAEPSQGSIRALIDRLFEQRLQDDQLADSPLNFRDLEIIANTFERMMTAILHRRIRYPSEEEVRKLKRGGDTRRNAGVPVG